MTTPGPWLQPADVQKKQFISPLYSAHGESFNSAHLALAGEITAWRAATNWTAVQFAQSIYSATVRVWRWAPSPDYFRFYPPDQSEWPPGATAVELESDFGVLLSLDAEGALRGEEAPGHAGTSLMQIPDTGYTYNPPFAATAYIQPRWWTPAELQTFPLLHSTPNATAQDFDAPITIDSNGQVLLLDALNAIRLSQPWDEPSYFGYVETAAGGADIGQNEVAINGWMRPPRLRYFGGPVPLRQRQRSDGLAIGAPRQFVRGRSSRQLSVRSGWAGTYL